MVYAIKDSRTDKLVAVSRPGTTEGAPAYNCKKMNSKANKLTGVTPYILVEVPEGTKADVSYKDAPELTGTATNASPPVKKKTTKEAKKVKGSDIRSGESTKVTTKVDRQVAEADGNSKMVCPFSYDCEGGGSTFVCTHATTEVDKTHPQFSKCPGCYRRV